MSNQGRMSPYVTPLNVATGAKVDLDNNGFALLPAGTYAFPLVSQSADIIGATLRTDAAIAFVATVECNSAPKDVGRGETITDWSDIAADADGWVQDNSTVNALTGQTGASGWTVAALTLTKVAGTASGNMVQLAGRGAARYRLYVVVTTQGRLAVLAHGKS